MRAQGPVIASIKREHNINIRERSHILSKDDWCIVSSEKLMVSATQRLMTCTVLHTFPPISSCAQHIAQL